MDAVILAALMTSTSHANTGGHSSRMISRAGQLGDALLVATTGAARAEIVATLAVRLLVRLLLRSSD